MRDEIDEETRYRLLKLLEAHPDLSQRQLAELMDVSLGKVNYCLKALVDVGAVKVKNFVNSGHKLKYLYVLTPSGIAEKAKVTQRFLERKEAEYLALEREIQLIREELGQRT